jgi:hypothetical protein
MARDIIKRESSNKTYQVSGNIYVNLNAWFLVPKYIMAKLRKESEH